ncbi:hypothetical protein EYD45_13920 [Hyunsoonleella flava]|uniref:Uncharacterized protein n=1 Tax=Hyunsoonleella flava TaxID=2527939 RepID=A0A4V2J9V5_9FLAO|nr:hypothetical protein [Hyunsoonleella flava]TBN00916.1 hypothetical protein EYD45_13920 [Hyunsoonleella flava]
MRKIVSLNEPKDGIIRLMIYNDEFGTYLFGFKKLEDCNSEWDEWYESEKDAIESCEIEYGIGADKWTDIPNPEQDCKHDRIKPQGLPILDYSTLNITRQKLADFGKVELLKKIERILNGIPIEKPKLHNKKNELETNQYRIDLDSESIEKIIDFFSDLEVSALDENYEPKSSRYSDLVDKWTNISE